ncbi:hypothetical protein [Vibrio spartinae]|uniref:hypothetical protein n=1 Tax=Vibrio spartinae TaxID=1918945 RepID=UPI0009444E36|nr:hypothetical protein [Vibrio spartinae]
MQVGFVQNFSVLIIRKLAFKKCFTQSKSTTQPRKPFTEEWLGFSGQDARKSWFWTTCDAVKQKRSSGYACILARVTGAQDTNASEIEKRNCASKFGAEGWGDEHCGSVV